jgi:hypothetical protein
VRSANSCQGIVKLILANFSITVAVKVLSASNVKTHVLAMQDPSGVAMLPVLMENALVSDR